MTDGVWHGSGDGWDVCVCKKVGFMGYGSKIITCADEGLKNGKYMTGKVIYNTRRPKLRRERLVFVLIMGLNTENS